MTFCNQRFHCAHKLPSHPNIHETSTGFCNFFALTSYNPSWKNLQSKKFMSFIETVNKLSLKENFGAFHHKKPTGGQVINTLKQNLLTIDQFNKWSFNFEQTRPVECAQHRRFESSIMSLQISQVVYSSSIL